jgi:MraZ protein
MLWGSYQAKVDEKFRLKIPAKFRHELAENEDNSFFVTSKDGHCAQIYPIAVWERIAQKLQESPRMDPAKQKLEKFTTYYGIPAQMDPQGRILIPQSLRDDACISGDVTVSGRGDHLEVWNTEAYKKDLREKPLTDQDRERLAELGF